MICFLEFFSSSMSDALLTYFRLLQSFFVIKHRQSKMTKIYNKPNVTWPAFFIMQTFRPEMYIVLILVDFDDGSVMRDGMEWYEDVQAWVWDGGGAAYPAQVCPLVPFRGEQKNTFFRLTISLLIIIGDGRSSESRRTIPIFKVKKLPQLCKGHFKSHLWIPYQTKFYEPLKKIRSLELPMTTKLQNMMLNHLYKPP